MKPLPDTFTKHGFNHRLVKRTGKLAIFQRQAPHHRDPHFEVIRIQSHNGYTLPAGKFAPPAEFYPSSEQWGTAGWTYNDLPTAEARFNALGDSLRLQRF